MRYQYLADFLTVFRYFFLTVLRYWVPPNVPLFPGEMALDRLPSVPFPWSLVVHHQSLARLYLAKSEAPEEETVLG